MLKLNSVNSRTDGPPSGWVGRGLESGPLSIPLRRPKRFTSVSPLILRRFVRPATLTASPVFLLPSHVRTSQVTLIHNEFVFNAASKCSEPLDSREYSDRLYKK